MAARGSQYPALCAAYLSVSGWGAGLSHEGVVQYLSEGQPLGRMLRRDTHSEQQTTHTLHSLHI